ncbi:hypothetical protein Tco_0711473 [Tanacetum coccineum]
MNHQLFNNNHMHRQTQLDSRFVVPSFLLSDDPIASLNKAMMFLNHVDAFDSDCDEAPTASAIFMARLSPAGSINEDVIGPTYDLDILFEDNAMILYVIEQMQSQVKQCNTINQEIKSEYESLTSELERYKENVKVLEER